MSDTVIEVSNISKQYRLGLVGTSSITEDFKEYWGKITGKPKHSLKVEQSNVISSKHETEDSGYIWALKDINFEVKQGEVLGIIGKNGAGKSTLLKILSKVTAPTTGSIKIKGRVASLLEVGTGFHPELTGRENLFLNGAILGMTKAEIRSKFDEIVNFSGVEKYIDTPVKRYSSGMYVRLAFAVAAHLEPEILIIDEVLAVGDVEFQKKCLGKMQDVSQLHGRTVLFVSHNMGAIISLCPKTIYLSDGKILNIGESEKMISHYLKNSNNYNELKITNFDTINNSGDEHTRILGFRFIDKNQKDIEIISVNREFGIEVIYEILTDKFKPGPNFLLLTQTNEKVFQSMDTNTDLFSIGIHKSVCWFPKNLLNDISYIFSFCLTTHNPVKIHNSFCVSFDVIDDINDVTRGNYKDKMHGTTRPLLKWENIKI